jgi:predicted phosphodiesterase
MVNRSFKILWILLLVGISFLIPACDVDILGLFASTDLDVRLNVADHFRFLKPEDMVLTLEEEYSFIVVADTHIDGNNAFGLEKLSDVTSNNRDIKFVVAVGDITHCGYEEELLTFIEIAGTFGVPCYPVIGNHDIYKGGWKNWEKLIGSTRYRIDGDGLSLFFLDTANAFFGKDQLNWLEKELKNANERVFIFTHTNLFVESPVEIQQFTDVRERAKIISILQGRCDFMFMGHLHKRIIKDTGSGGVTYLSGGVTYLSIEDFRNNNTYCRVDVKKSGIKYFFGNL